MIILIGYIILINVAAFILCGADKRKAVEHKWRISEAALLTVSAAGGALGMLISMKLFRHKTKHKKFTITGPLFIVLHMAVVALLVWKGVLN